MSTINDSDLFLVNRSNTSYKITASSLYNKLRDSDYMLVNRSNVSYRISGASVKSILAPWARTSSGNLTISSASISEHNTTGNRFTSQKFNIPITLDTIVEYHYTASIKVTLICKLISSNGVSTTTQIFAKINSDLKVTNLQLSDPGFVDIDTRVSNQIEFPAVLPSVQTPDDVLLDGTSIFVTVEAEDKVSSTVTTNTNIITPGATISNTEETLDASVPDDVVKFNNIKASFEGYENNRDAVRANLRTRILADGYTLDQVTSLGL